MTETEPQNYANHRRFDPAYHYFTLGVLAINVIVCVVNLFRYFGFATFWNVLMAAAFVVLSLKVRVYTLNVQDRVIRLEERLRLQRLLSGPLKDRIDELTIRQLIGLRFASDAEVPALAEKALAEKLSEDQIKKQIVNWRADTCRA